MIYTLYSLVLFQFLQLVLACLGLVCSKKQINIILVIQIISFAIFYGFRGIEIGADTSVYVSSYLTNSYWMEPGFVVCSIIINKLLGENWNLYLTSISFLILVFVALFYKIIFNNENIKFLNISFFLMTLLPYFILMQTNIIRQGMAITLLFLGLLIFLRNKNKLGLILMLLSWTFHYSMIFISVFVLFVYLTRLNRMYALLILVFSFIFYTLNAHQILIQMIGNEYLIQRIFGYQIIETNNSILVKFAFYLINYLVIIYFSNFIKDPTYKAIERIYSGILLGASTILFSEITVSRIMGNLDFLLPIIYLYPVLYMKSKKIWAFSVITMFFLFYLLNLYSTTMKINFHLY